MALFLPTGLIASAGGSNRNVTLNAAVGDDGRVQIEISFVQTGN